MNWDILEMTVRLKIIQNWFDEKLNAKGHYVTPALRFNLASTQLVLYWFSILTTRFNEQGLPNTRSPFQIARDQKNTRRYIQS